VGRESGMGGNGIRDVHQQVHGRPHAEITQKYS